jgi:hypothetical protein
LWRIFLCGPRDEFLRFIRQIHARLREIEPGFVKEQALAGLQ